MINLQTIIAAVNDHYQTDVGRRTRCRYVCEARHLACLLAVMARHGTTSIAKAIKRKHAKTVISDASSALDLLEVYPDFREDFVTLAERVGMYLEPDVTYHVFGEAVRFNQNGTKA